MDPRLRGDDKDSIQEYGMTESKQILESIYNNFCQKTGYGVVIGVEQEFYLREVRDEGIKGLGNKVSSSSLNKVLAAFPFFSELEEEKGEGQFEVQIAPTDNPAVMADMVEMLRKVVVDGINTPSNTHNSPVSFAAKPYPDQPGSGMHIHINLIDSSGNNVFSRNGDDESVQLNQSVAGLLELMPASIKYFAPYDAAYVRYSELSMNSPSTISWGGDNRTASLRIPSVPLTPHARRIEHRVPCADADPYLSIAAILAGVEFGIVNKLENQHPKIWGNAFLPQYELPKLAHNFKEAQAVQHEYLDMVLAGFFE